MQARVWCSYIRPRVDCDRTCKEDAWNFQFRCRSASRVAFHHPCPSTSRGVRQASNASWQGWNSVVSIPRTDWEGRGREAEMELLMPVVSEFVTVYWTWSAVDGAKMDSPTDGELAQIVFWHPGLGEKRRKKEPSYLFYVQFFTKQRNWAFRILLTTCSPRVMYVYMKLRLIVWKIQSRNTTRWNLKFLLDSELFLLQPIHVEPRPLCAHFFKVLVRASSLFFTSSHCLLHVCTLRN